MKSLKKINKEKRKSFKTKRNKSRSLRPDGIGEQITDDDLKIEISQDDRQKLIDAIELRYTRDRWTCHNCPISLMDYYNDLRDKYDEKYKNVLQIVKSPQLGDHYDDLYEEYKREIENYDNENFIDAYIAGYIW